MSREFTHVVMYQSDKTTGHVRGEPQLALPINTEEVGEIRLYRIALPFLPPSKNQFNTLQPTWQASMKKKWIKRVVAECEAEMIPKRMTKIGLSAALVFPTARRRDPQNYAATLWNFVPDALQVGGFILGDHDGTIEFGKNLGIQFHVDDRKGVPEVHRKRTYVSIAVRMGDGVD